LNGGEGVKNVKEGGQENDIADPEDNNDLILDFVTLTQKIEYNRIQN
jgi:hypothetical protein